VSRLAKAPDDIAHARAAAILAQIDLGNWEVLIDPTADDLAEIYGDGLAVGLPLVGMGVDLEQVNERSVEWAKERAASLVTQIEENTRDMLRDTVAQAIEEGWGAPELAANISASIGFSGDRASTIARTEIIASNNQGNLAAYKDAAAQGINVLKEWLLGDNPCEICEDNAADGPIPVDDEFSSGDDAPAAHPRCECSIGPVLSDETDNQDQEEEQ
jgi:plasmid stability protein